jgi:hypothetical protein
MEHLSILLSGCGGYERRKEDNMISQAGAYRKWFLWQVAEQNI